MELGQVSFNQATAETSNTLDVLQACHQAGIDQVSLWRHKYTDQDATRTRHLVDEHGMTVSSLCRGGFFTGTRSAQQARDDNHSAIEEAATLGAPVLVLVCGPLTDTTPVVAMRRIVAGIRQMLPAARGAGVSLAVEPFHPMFLADRSAVVSLAQANQIVAEIDDPTVGLAVDTYHVWWDPNLSEELRRAAGMIMTVHVADWLVPTPSLVAGRGLPGDGVIPIGPMLAELEATGFNGPVEVEVLNPAVWSIPLRDLTHDVLRRMARLTGDQIEAPSITAVDAERRSACR